MRPPSLTRRRHFRRTAHELGERQSAAHDGSTGCSADLAWPESHVRTRYARISTDPGEGIGIRSDPSALTPVERIDRCHLLGGQLEVEHVEVLLHSLTVHRLRGDDVAALDVPAEDDLRDGPPTGSGDPTDHLVIEKRSLAERTPRRHHDAMTG